MVTPSETRVLPLTPGFGEHSRQPDFTSVNFMSESTLIATASDRPKAPLQTGQISEAVIRLAGNSQDGIQAIGGFLARLAGRSEQEVMTFMTIPSTISGGPSIFQVRLGTGEVLSAGDEADMLVAFYQHSYENHLHSLKKGGRGFVRLGPCSGQPGLADRLPACWGGDLEPDRRSHRRHRQGQRQERFRPGVCWRRCSI
jgi:hypothetical protein